MSDEPTPKRIHPFLETVCGAVFMAFCIFLIVVTGKLVAAGIPAEDRAELVATLVWAMVGLLLSGLAGARVADDRNPLSFISSLVNVFRSTRR